MILSYGRCLFIGAFASYGYAKSPTDKNRLVIDEPAAQIVRRIYSMFIGGYGVQTIARRLNDERIPCPSAYKKMNGMRYRNSNRLDKTDYWTYSTVHNILKKQIYVGDMVQHVTNASRYSYEERTVPKEEQIVVCGTHEPIVSREIWEAAQSLMKEKYKSAPLGASHVFAGIAKCKECGRGLTKVTRSGEDYLVCGSYKRFGTEICTRHSIKLSTLSQTVLGAINEHIKALCDVRGAVRGADLFRAEDNDLRRRISRLECGRDNIKTKKKNMYGDYQDGLVTREEYIEYGRLYARDIDALQREIERLREELEHTSKREIEEALFQNLIERKSVAVLARELLSLFTESVYVS